MKINLDGIELIKSFEGCKSIPYRCLAGIWTVGWGHTGDDVFLNGIEKKYSQQEIDDLFFKDISFFEKGVSKLLICNINENQFSALISFAFNLGLNALEESTLLKNLNANMIPNIVARKEFPRWIFVNGKENKGLRRRRMAELSLFTKDEINE